MYLFPFKDICKNSKVVIYAYGKVGKSYVEQIKESQYCEIIAVVDKKYAGNTNYDVPIIGLDNLNEFDFDKIIIALFNRLERKQVETQLILMGIEKTKIYSEKPVDYFPVCHYKLDLELKNLSDIVYDIVANSDMEIRYSNPIISAIKKYNESNEMLSKFKDYIRNETNAERNVIIFRLLYEANVFDDELMQMYLDNILKLSNTDTMYYHFLEISNDIFYHPKYLYPNFYIDRKKILTELCDRYKLKIIRKARKKNKFRIAILSGRLWDAKIAVSSVIAEYANQLCSADCEVSIFLDEASHKSLTQKGALRTNSDVMKKNHKEVFDSNVKIHYNKELTVKQKLQSTLDLISEYDPDVIIDFSDEASVLTGVLYGVYPIMCVGIRCALSSTYFDSFFTRCKEIAIIQNEKFNSVDNNKFISEYLNIPPMPSPIVPMYRSEYDLSDDDFVLVTVGTRLEIDVDNNFTDHMNSLLTKYANIKWITVGENLGYYLLDKCAGAIERKQLIPWGFEKNLVGLYNLCDFYVNPNRKGGGISIRHAQEMGVPVLMNNYVSDGLMSIGVENAVGSNYDELFDYIEQLYNNRDIYMERKRITKEFVDKNNEKTTSEKIICMLEQTIKMFEERNFKR